MRIMNISVNLDGGLIVYINTYIFLLIIALIFAIRWIMTRKSFSIYSCEIDEVEIGIGNSKAKLRFTAKDKQIAYQIWTEIATRKIALPFDKENDVIDEVYNSWYAFFGITRELIKGIPVECIHKNNNTKTLVDIATEVLNEVLRPHLTLWQARFRSWYAHETSIHNDKSPQEIQKTYDQYESLVSGIIDVNKKMQHYQKALYKIAFGRSKDQ